MTTYPQSAGQRGQPESGDVLVPELIADHTYGSPTGPAAGGSGRRVSIAALLRRQRWVLVAGGVTAAMVYVVLTFLVPATFKSEADFLVANQDPLAGFDPGPGVDRLTTAPNRDTEVELLQSRSVVEAAVRVLDLRTSLAFAPTRRTWLAKASSLLRSDTADPRTFFLHLDLKPDADSDAYRLDGDPEEFRVTDSSGEIVASGPGGLIMRFGGVEMLPAEEPLPAPLLIHIKPLSETADAVRDRISARKLKQSTDLIRLRCEGRTATEARDLCSAVSRAYLELRADIQRSEAATATVFLGEQSTRLRTELEATEDSVRSRRVELLGQGIAADDDGRLARLNRRVSVLDERFRFVEARLREAEVAQAVDLPSVRLVDPASMPIDPAAPTPPLNLALSLLVFLGLGVAPAVHRERTDRRLRERTGVTAASGAPVLAMVPHLSVAAPVITVSLAIRPGERDVTLAPEWTEEREIVLEAFRTLAVDLRFVGERLGPEGLRTLAVTSATSGEGKTFTAANLAIVRASHGTRTCLVDADLRAGGVQRFFNWPRMPGLSEVLSIDADLERVKRSAQIAGRNLLDVIPSGAMNARSAELLESSAFEHVLTSLDKQYDLVVVDTPPLNILPDAGSVVARVDGVIVVVRAGVTDRTALELTLERLERAGASIAGVVLNDAALPRSYSSYTYARTESDETRGRRG